MNPLEAYKAAIEERSQAIQKLIRHIVSLYLAGNPDAARQETRNLVQRVETLREFFGSQVPDAVRFLKTVVNQWSGSPAVYVHLTALLKAESRLDSLWTETQSGAAKEFSALLEDAKHDADLTETLKQLVESLEKLITQGSDSMNRSVETELERLLAILRDWRKKSFFDVMVWVDFTAKGLCRIADRFMQFPCISLLYDGVKLAMEGKVQMTALYDKTVNEFRLGISLPLLNGKGEEMSQKQLEAKAKDLEKRAAAQLTSG